VVRIGGNTFYGGNSFVFIIHLKQIFLGTKNFEGELSRIAPRGYGPGLLLTHSLMMVILGTVGQA